MGTEMPTGAQERLAEMHITHLCFPSTSGYQHFLCLPLLPPVIPSISTRGLMLNTLQLTQLIIKHQR